MAMSPSGLGNKNDCAGEAQSRFTRSVIRYMKSAYVCLFCCAVSISDVKASNSRKAGE
jgi:hypothetical protein